jgi:hypothetical protein
LLEINGIKTIYIINRMGGLLLQYPHPAETIAHSIDQELLLRLLDLAF